MKKSLLSLLVSSIFVLSACNEQETQALTQKLKEAEQTITQLKADVEKSQQALNAYKAETETKLAEAEKAKLNVPYLKVDIESLFKKSETIKLKNNEFRDEVMIDYFVSIPKTQFDWLDNLVIRQILNNYNFDMTKDEANDLHNRKIDVNKVTGSEREELLKWIEKSYAEDLEAIKDGFNIDQTIRTSYLGQRENIVTFSQLFYSYAGGAHGMFGTNYINIDVNTQRIITLNTLVTKANQDKLKELLWQQYEYRNQALSTHGEAVEPFTSKKDFGVVDNFYFGDDGVTFVFPVYAIGAYAEGEIELTVSWDAINPILNEQYQRVEKENYSTRLK